MTSQPPPTAPRPQQPLDERLLRERVRSAAYALVRDLEQSRQATADWIDPEASFLAVEAAIERCLAELVGTGCWGEADRTPSSELWNVAGQWLHIGSLQTQARFKPRGYAGDFEMLAKICDDFRCHDPLGRTFDRYFQNQAAPHAVRNRTQLAADAIVAPAAAALGIITWPAWGQARPSTCCEPCSNFRPPSEAVCGQRC